MYLKRFDQSKSQQFPAPVTATWWMMMTMVVVMMMIPGCCWVTYGSRRLWPGTTWTVHAAWTRSCRRTTWAAQRSPTHRVVRRRSHPTLLLSTLHRHRHHEHTSHRRIHQQPSQTDSTRQTLQHCSNTDVFLKSFWHFFSNVHSSQTDFILFGFIYIFWCYQRPWTFFI